jgi:hypothetical protein
MYQKVNLENYRVYTTKMKYLKLESTQKERELIKALEMQL